MRAAAESGVAKETQRALDHGSETMIHNAYSPISTAKSQKGRSLATLLNSGGGGI
jgi:hypothetical protein